MSEYNKPLSLNDKQLIHQLKAYGYSLSQIAEAIGCARPTVVKILKQNIKALVENADNYQEQYLGSGCYITSYSEGLDGLTVKDRSIAYDGQDPTFDTVAEWEMIEKGVTDYEE